MPMEEIAYLTKARGEAPMAGTAAGKSLHARILPSPYASAKIAAVRLPVVPVGYYIVDHRVIQEENQVELNGAAGPVLPADRVDYVGQPILLVMGPELTQVERILAEIQVDYVQQEPVLDVNSVEKEFCDFGFEKGEVDQAFQDADQIYDEVFPVTAEMRRLEPLTLTARYADGMLTLLGSGECPKYLPGVVAKATGLGKEQIEIEPQLGEGGGDGYPATLACIAALGGIKANGVPVTLTVFPPEIGHTIFTRCRLAVKNGRLSGLDTHILLDGGCYCALSPQVLRRGMLTACSGYAIPHVRVRGRALCSNRPPIEQVRGLGGPQVQVALETALCHVAQDFGMDSLAFRERHLAHEEDDTPTGGSFHAPIPLSAMVRELDQISGYRDKHTAYRNQTGRFRKGAGLAFSCAGQEIRRPNPMEVTEEDFQGDQFTAYGWGVTTVEVELDTLTGGCRILNAHGLFDVRRWGDSEGIRGRVEGELLQGLTQAGGSMKDLPTALDVPELTAGFYSGGFSNLQDPSEVALPGGLAAYLAAVEQAVGGPLHQVPLTPAHILAQLRQLERQRAEEEAANL